MFADSGVTRYPGRLPKSGGRVGWTGWAQMILMGFDKLIFSLTKIIADCMPLVETREGSCIPIIIDSVIVWVDYGPVVFPSHTKKVFYVKIVCLVLVVFGYIFSAYILLYFIVSYKCIQRWSLSIVVDTLQPYPNASGNIYNKNAQRKRKKCKNNNTTIKAQKK
jgi:hypothetical protein